MNRIPQQMKAYDLRSKRWLLQSFSINEQGNVRIEGEADIWHSEQEEGLYIIHGIGLTYKDEPIYEGDIIDQGDHVGFVTYCNIEYMLQDNSGELHAILFDSNCCITGDVVGNILVDDMTKFKPKKVKQIHKFIRFV